MTPFRLAAVVVAFAIVAVAMLSCQARAADLSRAQWFKSLKVPGSSALCCDIADGHAVESKYMDGQWWVWLDNGPWKPVPANIVLPEISIDEDAYLFVYFGKWRCFVPPNNGS